MSYTVGMQTTNYVWDVAARLPVVLQDGENAYVYGLDLISATDDEGDQTYFLYDGLGSVTDVTDANGNVLASYSYDVFGAIRSQTGTSENYWLFTGEQNDADSGFYYLRALMPPEGKEATMPWGGRGSGGQNEGLFTLRCRRAGRQHHLPVWPCTLDLTLDANSRPFAMQADAQTLPWRERGGRS